MDYYIIINALIMLIRSNRLWCRIFGSIGGVILSIIASSPLRGFECRRITPIHLKF